ncbi:MAG: lysine--tRNA ligase [Anaerolineae bacterium]|nr:lysine--tRNA ligase [Anaerolineae bacterium]
MATNIWIEQTADMVEKEVVRRNQQRSTPISKIVCASGISPSGPIHLGNLREAITVHLVSEELKARGWQTEHIHSWDDFDRLRKVPANIPANIGFEEHVGKPLAEIPDPWGEYPSYGSRFKDEFEKSMNELGIKPRYISQSVAYRRGDYTKDIIHAISKRLEIFDILAEYQTLDRFEKSQEERREEYYPVRVYCEACNKDNTTIHGYEPASATITYSCTCGHKGSFSLYEKVPCKLVWKADWPMRWNYEQVVFEPAGEDHAAPGSSYTVGKKIVADIFGYIAPVFIGYAFVGMGGRSKISSSAGTTATPRAALDILEPPMVRWLYIRRDAGQKFNIDFGQEVLRLYDEWDSFCARVNAGKANDIDRKIYNMSVNTSLGDIYRSQTPVSFRLLSSAADLTQGNKEQIMRIAADQLKQENTPDLQTKVEPRLSCAIRWATQYVPDDERTFIRPEFAADVYAGLSEQDRQGVQLLVEKLESNWNLDDLTHLVYGIPKTLLGLPQEAQPTEELKQAQRAFFIAVYSLVCNSETGPRLPTLFLSLGLERVKSLLQPAA